MNHRRTRRILPKRRPGINNPRAAFWIGERCEQIVEARLAAQKAAKELRRHGGFYKRALKRPDQICNLCGKHVSKCAGRKHVADD